MISSEKHQKSFIVVHAGAGYHAAENEEKYLNVCRVACTAAMQCLKSGNNAVDAVTKAVKMLEDSPCTNAGVGSNLTLEGSVECDAGVMDGKSLTFGAVGSVSGVKNPVALAHKLVLVQLEGLLSLGRIPPSVMVGEGARQWACQHGLQCVSTDSLITDTSRKTYNRYKRKLDSINNCVENKRCKTNSDSCYKITGSDCLPKKLIESSKDVNCTASQNQISFSVPSDGSEGSSDLQNTISVGSHGGIDLQDTLAKAKRVVTDVQDTVGAVCVDQAGNMAAAASSGGIWLKQMGRVGPAACFGAGCWAHNGVKNKTPGIAVATTGCGEHLMKTLLAKQCGDALQKGDDGSLTFKNVLEDGFLKSEFLHGVQDKNAGMLGLVFEQVCDSSMSNNDSDNSCSVEVLWGHTTSSMCVGYMSEVHHKPRALISRLPPDSNAGATFAVQGKLFML
ncbi:threonine aspartase 1-like [Gigantopelta aegis]|uniref:threonine aspartase 1-like n=1 Tax=Gigantopelta aegis TaxID=1735272 RepID=UPI001B887521|nr:threonine aspartase 1-like [Gigantopelta aegis]XP_041369356.1 threonine aspartase 1-like [Gigantopelta aegis]XP_041369357.1 threonine aspartase 1-like [Gigantopelta aegis]XP_041369358.1 threonine aspartase 1-like [Gigantopelta aegis]